MPKIGMEAIRRKQLIDATIASIHEDGFAETTVARISKRAGVSAGIIHHYFGGKEDLLAATLRQLLTNIRNAVSTRLARAGTPMERIDAIIDGNFAAEQFTPQAVSAWLTFWAQVAHAPQLARLQRINSERSLSNIRHALKQMLPVNRAEEVSLGLSALIDGLWLRCAMSPDLDGETARRIARDYVIECLHDSGSKGREK
jgi:TetR/AcrR family transcriptional repressor of bet genes